MRGVLCSHDYGILGKKYPCPICEYDYDPGFGYLFRPCPRCGYLPEEWAIQTVILGLSLALKTSQGKIRKVLANEMGLNPETLKRWQYKGVKKNVDELIDRFSDAVRVFINREENREKITKMIEEQDRWYQEALERSSTQPPPPPQRGGEGQP